MNDLRKKLEEVAVNTFYTDSEGRRRLKKMLTVEQAEKICDGIVAEMGRGKKSKSPWENEEAINVVTVPDNKGQGGRMAKAVYTTINHPLDRRFK